VVRDMEKNHTWAFAGALAYYFILALFPFLILFSAIVIQQQFIAHKCKRPCISEDAVRIAERRLPNRN